MYGVQYTGTFRDLLKCKVIIFVVNDTLGTGTIYFYFQNTLMSVLAVPVVLKSV
jgi:hypothetical protein